jgi:tRNA (cytosine38-C5)-methyltransferase
MNTKKSTMMDNGNFPVVSTRNWKVIEFFSGIGGWASALDKQKDLKHEVVACYDVNSVSNEVYEYVYRKLPSSSSIESLSSKTLDAFQADIWVMSPPCQPFTRQHPPTEKDPRSNALTHLMKTMIKMKVPPTYLALENVVGFEQSPSCKNVLETLESLGYEFMQFALSPTQFGVPNERPRYYLLAVRNGSFEYSDKGQYRDIDSSSNRYQFDGNDSNDIDIGNDDSDDKQKNGEGDDNISNGIDNGSNNDDNNVNDTDNSNVSSSRRIYTSIPGQLSMPAVPLSSYISQSLSLPEIENLLVPEKLLEKNASWCMDIVTAKDKTTSCFTKSYSKYFKGTGSVLLISDPSLSVPNRDPSLLSSVDRIEDSAKIIEVSSKSSAVATTVIDMNNPDNLTAEAFQMSPAKRKFNMDWKDELQGNKLRFFSPDELIRLFGFRGLDHIEINKIDNERSIKDIDGNDNGNGKSNDGSSSSGKEVNEEVEMKNFFPPHIPQKKCFELIGNSLNVIVVSHLLDFLFHHTVIRNESENEKRKI